MQTISFIGSDKNAGKTTVFNYVHMRLREEIGGGVPVCVSSIGINGEDADAYEGRQKPRIPVSKGGWFVTASERLKALSGKYEIFRVFSGPDYKKSLVMGKCLLDCEMVLEGPNDGNEILSMKREMADLMGQGWLLIDGSIDRQFLARPAISDGIYFALLVSDRKEQMRKAEDLLFALSIPACSENVREIVKEKVANGTKSFVFDENGNELYHGKGIPFLDEDLKKTCHEHADRKNVLYLNGALSASLFAFLSPMRQLTVILDNFTLYQNVSVRQNITRIFRPELALLHPALVKRIFVKQDGVRKSFFADGVRKSFFALKDFCIPVHNLFREAPDEIGI